MSTSNLGGATPPPGLPDLGELARLATQFFSALPGDVKEPAGPTAGSPTASPGPAASGTAPELAHTVGAGGAPGAATAPGGGRAGGIALGVPEAYAAALPNIGALSAPQGTNSPIAGGPSSPYYFLDESSAYQHLAGSPDDRVTPQPLAMPGEAGLLELLRTIEPDARAAQAPTRDGDTRFYFTEHTAAPAAAAQPTALGSGAHPAFDVDAVRRDFPILSERVNGRPLVWFDNAATTQKPQAVIDRLSHFYAHENSNIHRAAHQLAARSTDAYEAARSKVARFIGAGSSEEIIWVRGTTEAINLVAQTWGRQHVGEGDEIVLSHLEHHANIVPWQRLASEKRARIRVIPVDDSGQVLLDEYRRLLNDRTRIVAVSQVSNALGTIVPVKEIVDMAHRSGARTLIDGAQSVSHMRVNVQSLDTDFFVFSGHKVFGPTGIGAVYGKRELLQDMPPYQGGGNMISDVTFERTLYADPPARLEAGTGNIADAVGLGAALDYLERIGLDIVSRYEHDLLQYATAALQSVPGLRLIGTAKDKASVLSFVLAGYKVEEVGKALDQEGIAVRAGHHCAQPILRRFGLEATVRPSLAFYNTCAEVDRLAAVLRQLAQARSTRRGA